MKCKKIASKIFRDSKNKIGLKNKVKKSIINFYRPNKTKMMTFGFILLALGLEIYYLYIYTNSCFNNGHLSRCEADWFETAYSSIFLYPFFMLGQSLVLLLLYIYTLSCIIAIVITKIKNRPSKKERKNSKFKRVFKIGLIAILVALISVIMIHYEIKYKYNKYTFLEKEDNPQAPIAMILGAKVYDDKILSHIYYDRVETALKLYQNGDVEKILISGDHGRKDYDEVNAAKDHLLERGVNGDDIFLDHAGFDTYDSMYRARDIFQVNDMIIVTQEFHLPRAVYIARKLGIEAYGTSADKRIYRDALRNDIRESLARVKAVLNIIFYSKPKYLGEPIPITGDSHLSWDKL